MIIIPESIPLDGMGEETGGNGYKTVPDIVTLLPQAGTTQAVTLPQDRIPAWDPAAKYAYKRRPKFEYAAPEMAPIETGVEISPNSYQADEWTGNGEKTLTPEDNATSDFGDKRRRNGRGRVVRKADIDFVKMTDEPYEASKDSIFDAETEPIRREFAIMPDLRPVGPYMTPSYQSMNGLGTTFVRVPAMETFDQMDRQYGMQGLGASWLENALTRLKGTAEDIKKTWTGEEAAPAPSAAPQSVPTPPGKGMPTWAWVAIAGAGALAVGGIIMVSRR